MVRVCGLLSWDRNVVAKKPWAEFHCSFNEFEEYEFQDVINDYDGDEMRERNRSEELVICSKEVRAIST